MDLAEILERDVLEGARALLGRLLISDDLVARIVEVEAYRSPDDPGCHAHRGRTPRNAVMFDRPGLAYVYFVYGVHWALNVVAHPPGVAAAVLIRAAEPLSGLDVMRSRRRRTEPRDLLSGPGKLAQAFGLDGRANGLDLLDPSSPVRIEPGRAIESIEVDRRVGLAPGKGDDLPWRFLDAEARDWWSQPIQRASSA